MTASSETWVSLDYSSSAKKRSG